MVASYIRAAGTMAQHEESEAQQVRAECRQVEDAWSGRCSVPGQQIRKTATKTACYVQKGRLR